jgi:hypothetical protein
VSCDFGGCFGCDKVRTLLLSGVFFFWNFDEVASGVLAVVIPSSVIADITVDDDTMSGNTSLLDSLSDATTLDVCFSKHIFLSLEVVAIRRLELFMKGFSVFAFESSFWNSVNIV